MIPSPKIHKGKESIILVLNPPKLYKYGNYYVAVPFPNNISGEGTYYHHI